MLQQRPFVLHMLLDFLYPAKCLLCDTFQKTTFNTICPNCKDAFRSTNLGNWINTVANPLGIDRAYSGWFFDNEIQKVIHSLKYQERAKLGRELGRYLAQELRYNSIGPLDILIPVPLHPVKKRERGYNQAEWIVKGLAEIWKVPYSLNRLVRRKYTISQTTLNAEERLRNMKDAFRVRKSVVGLNIGVVDDVLTTGSTISACAISLKKEGANQVVAISCSTPIR
ncbi:MAG: ComF family protein [FCB group bacterium]|nr:ComF family protein [FCB group bacterium]